ncbi:sugar transferase (plasmid) [Tundrisphaera lichenicola]|uniref:sugar transferase n=1 Tax=Tundrisphaera lichenicola TaxID=2029860 RepID=UPI003EB89FB0
MKGPLSREDWYTSAKAVADYLLAGVLLLLTFPILITAGILTRLTSRGPAIYRQIRHSRSGREFTIYKIRSMYVDCERTTGPLWSTPGDPRLTRLGKFLRRSHIDELPQLFNVLRGEMSLIGPRPERPEFVRELEKSIPFYRDRERILPGVTGLAQVQLPPDTDVSEVHRKLACDLYYLQNQGPWLDLRILMSTATKVVGLPTRVSCRLFGIPSGPQIEEHYHRLTSSARGWAPSSVSRDESEVPSAWVSSFDAERRLALGD